MRIVHIPTLGASAKGSSNEDEAKPAESFSVRMPPSFFDIDCKFMCYSLSLYLPCYVSSKDVLSNLRIIKFVLACVSLEKFQVQLQNSVQ